MREEDLSRPWKGSPLETEIIESHEAEIIGEIEGQYVVAFPDYDGSLIEAEMGKEEFENFPHPVRVGTCFGIIVYKIKGEQKKGAWPVAKYWNEELRLSEQRD